ncbi:phage minor head protein [Falsiroseomonas sp. CW058]|uniref:phage minor head protein n=1 Tax=Falsiroseomonas sp. CW058 TaxID=3388664 RepID=UPI003D31118A
MDLALDEVSSHDCVQKRLSDAQIEQRREAARSRWRKAREAGASVAGAVAGGVAAERAAVALTRAGNRDALIARAARMRRDDAVRNSADEARLQQSIDSIKSATRRTLDDIASRRARASVEWVVPRRIEQIQRQEMRERSFRLRNREAAPDGAPVVRDIDAEIASQVREAKLAGRRRDLELARKPRRVRRAETEAQRRSEAWTRTVRRSLDFDASNDAAPHLSEVDRALISEAASKEAADEMRQDALNAWLRRAARGRVRTTRKVVIPMSGDVGAKFKREATTQRVPPSIDGKNLDRIRRAVLSDLDRKAIRLRARSERAVSRIKRVAEMRHAPEVRAARTEERIRRLSSRVLTRFPSRRGRLIAAATGAAIGGAGAYALSKSDALSKIAPPDGSVGVGPVAGRLTRAFLSLRERAAEIIDRLRANPSDSDTRYRDKLREALDPLGRPFIGGARHAVSGDPTIAVSFDLIEPRVFTHLEAYRLDLIRQIEEGQRETIRRTLTTMMAQGAGPEAISRRIRDTVGLTAYQAQAVANYRAELESADVMVRRRALGRELRDRRYDRSVIRSLASDEPIPRERVDAMVEAYQRRYIALRATTIARTEGLRASNLGGIAAAREASDAFNLQVEKTWLATGDDRTRDSHRGLHGKTVTGIDAAFVLPNGVAIRHPHDPEAPAGETVNCRCTLQIRLTPRRGRITNLMAEAV